MRIRSIPQLYRNLNRWGEILSVLSKYGLADWISRLDIDFAKELFKDPDGEVLARHSPEARIRLALSELGPTFIKLGQILSTRGDLVGVRLAHELRSLQDQVRADAPDRVRATIESELGRPIDACFAEFDEQPIASASIGQVHRARLHTGQLVAVKVQHAGIHEKVREDTDILIGLAELAERIPEFAAYRPTATVTEFQRVLRRELDFSREARHVQQFARNFANDPRLHVPRLYDEFCTSRVMVMEYMDGVKLDQREQLVAAGVDLAEVARRGAMIYLEMIFEHGFYHADPHPGNLMVLPENVIGLLDFGMVGRIDDSLREDVEEMLLAISQRDAVLLTSLITRIGAVPPGMDQAGLCVDVADFVAHYGNLRMDEFDLSGALDEIMEMIRRYRITLPARIAMLIKVFAMLEGTSQLLAPKFSLMEVMAPYQQKMAWRRLSPVRHLRKLRRFQSEIEHLLGILPRGIGDILEQIQSGKFDVHLDHRGLEPSVNRLVYGMITSALFLGSSLMLSQRVPPLVHWPAVLPDFSLPGAFGCVLSVALGLRLLRAINNSGHLDREVKKP